MVRHPRSPRFQAKYFFLLPVAAVTALALFASGGPVRAQSLAVAEAAPIPVAIATINVEATVSMVIARTGDSLVVTFTRNGGDTAKKVFVYYALKGSAKNGTDYRFANGRLKIKPNKTSAKLTLTPLISGPGGGLKTIRLKVRPNAAYAVGTDQEVKLHVNYGG